MLRSKFGVEKKGIIPEFAAIQAQACRGGALLLLLVGLVMVTID